MNCILALSKSSQVIDRSLDSRLSTLKSPTEAYIKRNELHFILTSLTPVNYVEHPPPTTIHENSWFGSWFFFHVLFS